MNHRNTAPTFLLAAIAGFAVATASTKAADISIGTTAPVVDALDESNNGTPTGSQKWFDDIEHDAGQTFTPAADGLLESFTIFLSAGNPNDGGSENVDIRFGTISRPGDVFTFTDVYSENAAMAASPAGDWVAGDYVTFTFDTPQAVTAGVEYGIITDAQSMGAWQEGIPYRHTTGNDYAGGSLINRGGESAGRDLVFHANITSGGADTTPPAISSLNPADDATDAAAGGNLVITFNEDVQKGTTGNIVITETGVAAFETIPVTDARVSVSGPAVTIDPTGTFLDGTAYHVQIDAGAIGDTATTTNDFPGIIDTTTWNFTTATVDVTNPAVLALSPADDEINVGVNANLVITFDEDVQKGTTGDIVITETGVGVFETIPVTDASVTVSGDTVTIDPAGTFLNGVDYHVELALGAIKDLSNNDFAGISGATAWNFTTLAVPGTATISISTVAPTVDALDVSNNGTPTGTQKWFDDIEHDAGQTFTPTSDGFLESFTIYLSAGNPNDGGAENVDVRFGTISRPGDVFTFTDVYSENAAMAPSPGGDWEAGDYITFTFETPQAVTAGVEYGIITDAQSMGAWQQGIPYRHTTGNDYAGGSLINRGGEVAGRDLVFHANITSGGADTTPPEIAALNPADDATDAAADGNLVITFNETVQKGTTGNIVITETGVGAFETIPVTDARVEVSGAVVTIDPAGTLLDTTAYDVQIDAGAIRDNAAAPNDFPGILDATTWNFTTAVVDVTNPTVLMLSPADDEINVGVNANLVITFDEDVQKGTTGDIFITETGVGAFETIPVTDASVTVSGDTVTIDPAGTFLNGVDYHVELAPGAIKDLSNNDFAGISGATAWNFTTLAVPGTATISISTVAPTVDALDVSNNGTPTGTQKWFDDIEHDAGQTFTPPSDGFLQSFTIYLSAGNPNDGGAENVDVRFGTISRPGGTFTFTDVYSENAAMAPSPGGDWEAGDYITFTFETPQAVTAGVEYGIITDAQSMGAWQQGIPYRHTTGNDYAGGVLINRGGESAGRDLVFHADITSGPGGGNDYTAWAAMFPGEDLSDPNGDLDGDGVSNNEERLFGTDPTKASSLNQYPTGLFESTTSTFSFSRRDDALTGLFSDIETSFDLQMWTEDIGAMQVEGTVDGSTNVEIVEVTLSPGLLTAPKLFVRVNQNEGVLISENFEVDNGGFTVVTTAGTDWEHGAPDSSGLGGTVTEGNGGSTNAWGTDLGDFSTTTADAGFYDDSTITSLRSTVIDLTDVTAAELLFAEALDLEAGDTAVVNIIDDTTDTVIAAAIYTAVDGDDSSADWANVGPIAIPAGALGQAVRIEWRFTGFGGTSDDYMGWYIDDVTVRRAMP